MNRRDIDEMRARLAARTATDGEDPPAALIAACILFVALVFFSAFL